MLFQKKHFHPERYTRFYVSILILLDVISEGNYNCQRSIIYLTFQSLFCWMLFQKNNRAIVFCKFKSVSILILLDVISEELTVLGFIVLFQGFNPYSVGCYFRSISVPSRAIFLAKFQSLFCWMLFQKKSNSVPS